MFSNTGQTNPAESKTVFKWMTTKMEDDQNGWQKLAEGRGPKRKTTWPAIQCNLKIKLAQISCGTTPGNLV